MWGRGRRRHRRRGWRRGPGNLIGLLRPYLLLLLHRQRAHGYALLEQLSEFGLDVQSLNPGLVYRALREMEAEGYLASEWDAQSLGPPRRVYRITAEGEEGLARWVGELRKTARSLKGFIDAYETHIESDEQMREGGA